MIPDNVYGIIFAGGLGSRLWPISTQKNPKQINTAFSSNTMLVDTFKRVTKVFPKDRIMVITNEQIYDKTRKLVDLPHENFIIQPENADTAAAVGLAAIYLERYHPGTVAISIYSDHLISSLEMYKRAINKAVKIASNSPQFVTLGTYPTEPNTNFGYIKKGSKTKWKNVYKIKEFIEKPGPVRARHMLKSSRYVWNTGIHIWQVETMLSVYKDSAPKFFSAISNLIKYIGTRGFDEKLSSWYDDVKHVSFEQLIPGKTTDELLLVAKYNWRDIGNWKEIYNLSKKDEDGVALLLNHSKSKLINVKSKNCLIVPKQKNIAIVGLKNIIVVQTKDDVLICNMKSAHEVKEIVKSLKQK